MVLLDLPSLDPGGEYGDDDAFPPTDTALDYPNGLLAWGGSLRPARLLEAYRRGIFPWYSEGEPLLWWTPSPRCVLYPADVYVSRRTRQKLRQRKFAVTADVAFADVMAECAAPRPNRPSTWITPEMLEAYGQLHKMGVAHSVEAWLEERLVGGVYGLSIGRMFFGESMFSLETDASKIALITLCRQLEAWRFGPLDCQVGNPHLLRMGAVEIERGEFEAQLGQYTGAPAPDKPWLDEFRGEWAW